PPPAWGVPWSFGSLAADYKPRQGDSAMKWKPRSGTAMLVFGTAALLLTPPPAMAGPATGNGSGWFTSSQSVRPSPPAPVRAAPPPQMTVSVAVPPATPQPAGGPVFVNLRGPDGQVRRFPVEGGAKAIETTQIVIRPGQSVTIRWRAAR